MLLSKAAFHFLSTMTTGSISPPPSSSKGFNATYLSAFIFITAGSILLCFFQYDLWTGRCEHLAADAYQCEGCLELEYKPNTCEASAACSWAAATYLGVGVMMLWIEKHRLANVRSRKVVDDVKRKELNVSLPPVSMPFSTEDETPQEEVVKLQVV